MRATSAVVCLILLVSLLASGCGETSKVEAETPPEPLRLSLDPLLTPLARELIALSPTIDVVTTKSNDEVSTFADLLRGDLDGALTLREPTSDEQRVAKGRDLVRGLPLSSQPLARDHLALVVAVGNSLRTIDKGQLADVLSMNRTEWEGLHGTGPLTLVARPRDTSVWSVLLKAVPSLTSPPVGLRAVATDHDVVKLVTDTEGGFGVCSSTVVRSLRVLPISDGGPELLPGEEEWPLTREIVLVTRGPAGRLAPLVQAANSPAGVRLIRELGFFPVSGAAPQ